MPFCVSQIKKPLQEKIKNQTHFKEKKAGGVFNKNINK
jgi:hypothetical protein